MSTAKPLRELTRKDVHFEWSKQCQKTFALLKDKLSGSPTLAYPSFDKPFTMEIHVDASISGLGAVPSQIQNDGKLYPIAYTSCSLTPAERNYSVTELDSLAGVGFDPFSLLCVQSERDCAHEPHSYESGV